MKRFNETLLAKGPAALDISLITMKPGQPVTPLALQD